MFGNFPGSRAHVDPARSVKETGVSFSQMVEVEVYAESSGKSR